MDNYYNVMPVEEKIETAYKSKNGLYPHEILILSYAPKFTTNQESFPRYWQYRHGVTKVKDVVDSLYIRGFIAPGSSYDVLPNKKLPEIKSLLKAYGLSVSGNKPDLIQRIIDNLSEIDIQKFFPEKYYVLTALGNAELEDNSEIIKINKSEYYSFLNMNIWDANKLRYENPKENIYDLIHSKIENYLQDIIETPDYWQIFYKQDFAIPYYLDNGNDELALQFLSCYIYFELNNAKSGNNSYLIEHLFPYSTSNNKLHDRTKNWLARIKHNLSLTNEELEEKIVDYTENKLLKNEILTSRECAQIAIYDIRNEIDKIEEIGKNVKERYTATHPDKETTFNNEYIEYKQKKSWEDYIIESEKPEITEDELRLIEKKEKILMQSFEILKNQFEENYEQIFMIMVQLQERQPETVIEMWKYFLNENWDKVVQETNNYNSISYYLTNTIMKALTDEKGFVTFEPYFISEPLLLQAVYQYTPQLSDSCTSVIGTQIRSKNFAIANTMMEYTFANKKNHFIKQEGDYDYNIYTFSKLFKNIIENYITTSRLYYGDGIYRSDLWKNLGIDQEIVDFLSYWAEKIDDPVEKAKVDVYIMELL